MVSYKVLGLVLRFTVQVIRAQGCIARGFLAQGLQGSRC